MKAKKCNYLAMYCVLEASVLFRFDFDWKCDKEMRKYEDKKKPDFDSIA